MTGERKILPIVMADIAHAASPTERTVLDHGETGFSRLWAAFSSRPCQTRLNSGPVTRTALADVNVLLLTSLAPAKLMMADEVRIVRGFLDSGGMMLLTNNDMSREAIDVWVNLAREFGIQSHGSVLRITPQTGQRGWHVSRYSGAGLARWLPETTDAPLCFQGTVASPVDGSVLVSYDGSALAARQPLGKGEIYAFGGDMLGNAFALGQGAPDRREMMPANALLIDAVAAEILERVSVPVPR